GGAAAWALVVAAGLAVGASRGDAAPMSGFDPGQGGIHILDVGQGSAALILSRGGRTIAIDAGPADASEVILAALEAHGRQRIDLWVFTHYDADHIGGMPRVLAGRDGVWGNDD